MSHDPGSGSAFRTVFREARVHLASLARYTVKVRWDGSLLIFEAWTVRRMTSIHAWGKPCEEAESLVRCNDLGKAVREAVRLTDAYVARVFALENKACAEGVDDDG